MKSPCIGCDHEHKDKNTEKCANCRDRLEYNVAVGNLPKEVLERENGEENYKERVLTVSEAQMGVDMADLKAGESTKRKRGRPKKVDKTDESSKEKKGPKKGKQKNLLRIRDTGGPDIYVYAQKKNPEITEIFRDLREIAKKEIRSMNEQIIWFIREGVNKWKKEHDA